MKTNKNIKNIPIYTIIEKESTERAIFDDLIYGNKFTEISFSYKTEILIQFMYYCLTYFFKKRTYGESFHNIELFENDSNKNNESYLFKLKIILPNLLKLILKYLSLNNRWFNFTFRGFELIDLIICFEHENNKINEYSSLLNYLLKLKYRLVNGEINQDIIYSNWFTFLIDSISDIISEITSLSIAYFKSKKLKLYNFLGFDNNKENNFCQICKQFPVNSISLKCGHCYCYYCLFYNSKLLFPKNEKRNICLICRSE